MPAAPPAASLVVFAIGLPVHAAGFAWDRLPYRAATQPVATRWPKPLGRPSTHAVLQERGRGFAIAAGMWNPESLSEQAHGTTRRQADPTGHRRRTRNLEVTA